VRAGGKDEVREEAEAAVAGAVVVGAVSVASVRREASVQGTVNVLSSDRRKVSSRVSLLVLMAAVVVVSQDRRRRQRVMLAAKAARERWALGAARAVDVAGVGDAGVDAAAAAVVVIARTHRRGSMRVARPGLARWMGRAGMGQPGTGRLPVMVSGTHSRILLRREVRWT